MWKTSKRLAACMLAAVWWSVFYPELCFSEETCAVVQTDSAQDEGEEVRQQAESVQEKGGEPQRQAEGAQNESEGLQSRPEKIDAADVWQASGDRLVIRSRLWEWCEERFYE